MLTASQVAETYFLESRYMLLEIAAYLDRYDAASIREHSHNGNSSDHRKGEDPKLTLIRKALASLADPAAGIERTSALLELFATL